MSTRARRPGGITTVSPYKLGGNSSIGLSVASSPDVSSFKPLAHFGPKKETFLDVHQGLCKG